MIALHFLTHSHHFHGNEKKAIDGGDEEERKRYKQIYFC